MIEVFLEDGKVGCVDCYNCFSCVCGADLSGGVLVRVQNVA